ncbi:MAG: serine hydrolase [Acidobacteria bacterium]|nr:serine hydrolase [Acidobacteriota bacterium]
MERFRALNLEFEPGAKFKYSNSGYVLLGVVIEKASGASYASFVRQCIFEPLGMRDTGYDTNAAILPKRAEAYQRAGKDLRHAAHIDMTIPHAAGALYSTVQHLFKWDRALQAGKLLSPNSMTKYFTPALDKYAYGWIVRTVPDGKLVMHGGGINGFATDIKRMPEKNLVAIAPCNAPPCDPGRITNDALAIVLGGNPASPKDRTEVQVSREVKARYVGDYELMPSFILTVTLEGDQLMTQATRQGKLPVFPESETKFFPKVVDALITFETDEGGKARGLVLEQGGRRMPAKRR